MYVGGRQYYLLGPQGGSRERQGETSVWPVRGWGKAGLGTRLWEEVCPILQHGLPCQVESVTAD